MTKLYEILAVEKTKQTSVNKLIEETFNKFNKEHFFTGYNKTLTMLKDSLENKTIESGAKEVRELPTTVEETLNYIASFWADSEDIIFTKNKTNQLAVSDIMYKGSILCSNVPVDELMGLESRLEALRKLCNAIPTLDASKSWESSKDGRKGSWKTSTPEVTVKTEKITTPIVLYEATKEHPAQIKEVTKDEIVGQFSRQVYSGSATSKQKADILSAIDNLLIEVKQARMRANSIEIVDSKIGLSIIQIILDCFK